MPTPMTPMPIRGGLIVSVRLALRILIAVIVLMGLAAAVAYATH